MLVASPVNLLDSAWSFLAILPLLLSGSSQLPCPGEVFDSCRPPKKNAPKWKMECDVIFSPIRLENSSCIGSQRVVPLDSDNGKKFDALCDLRTCTIRAHWCQWEAWSSRSQECGVTETVKRYRYKCCHPTSGVREGRVNCAFEGDRGEVWVREEQKEKRPARSCSYDSKNDIADNDDNEPDSGLTRQLITAFVVGLLFLIMIVIFSCIRRKHQAFVNRELSSLIPTQAAVSAPSLLPTTPTVLNLQYEPTAPLYEPTTPLHEHVVRPATPPPAYGVPPPYNSAWMSENAPAVAPDPESPPPQYEAALQLMS